MKRIVVALLIGATASVGGAAASGDRFASPPYLPKLTRAHCPHAIPLPVQGQLDRIRSALPMLVKRQLGHRASANGPNGPSFRGWQLLGAISLYPTSVIPVPGAAHWRALAAARCGATIADRSWLLVLQFPQMHVINSIGRFLIARTRHGWTLWAWA